MEVIVLYASVSADHVSKGRTEDLQRLLQSKGVPFTLVDATTEENKDVRNHLFTVSGKRAVYPQVFFKKGPDAYTFVGLHGDIVELNDMEARMGAFSRKFAPVLQSQQQQPLQQQPLPVAAAVVPVGGSQQLPEPVAVVTSPVAAPSVVVAAAAPGGAAPADATPAKPTAPAGNPAWSSHQTSSGEAYYFNTATGESSWLDPSTAIDAACTWFKLRDEKRQKHYYYNRSTGESRWKLPEAVQATKIA